MRQLVRERLALGLSLCSGVCLLFILGCGDDSAGGQAPMMDASGLQIDKDGDEVSDPEDNCVDVYNPDQRDLDGDGSGDLCDPDDDGDGVLDTHDGCPTIPDPARTDTDGDGLGDACDEDDDADGIADAEDACPLDSTFAFGDLDGDGRGDACDRDRDGDTVNNPIDNCPDATNIDQSDVDGDGLGDACDVDSDGDGLENTADNCRLVANPEQLDMDDDNVGDLCDPDLDGDAVDNVVDNCVDVWNASQGDRDEDGRGDQCDICPQDMHDDGDGDGLCAIEDNCPTVANVDQVDGDGDGLGDLCDQCPVDSENDLDADGYCGTEDNCPSVNNVEQVDLDGDGLGDVCDACPLDGGNDADADGICGDVDLCPDVSDVDQLDFDTDGIGDFCDACPSDPTNDPDRDNVCNDIDLCPDVPDPDQRDRDGDGLGDACDACLRGGGSDPDRDGVCNESDNCPRFANFNQSDLDEDGLGDVCDLCPEDADNDLDGDGLCGNVDACPSIPDPAQDDADEDGIGDRCDEDVDGDGIINDEDNCPYQPNADQLNSFGGPQGDVCELLFFYEDFEEGLAGWELSGRWVRDESAAFRGMSGLVEGDNTHTRIVAVNTPPIDLTRSERPRLSFWVRRQANQSFYVDVYVDRNLRDSFRVVGPGERERNGFQYHTFDLRGFEGRDSVRVRFRMDGQGGFGRLTFDEVTVDENPSPPSVGIPFTDEFDTLENWRPSAESWTLAGPAWTPEFAATVPSGPASNAISKLDLRWGVDLRATRAPELVVWTRSGGALQRGQWLEVLIEPANGVTEIKRLIDGDGNTLFARHEIPLGRHVGDPDVRISFRFHHGGRPNPAIYVDSFMVRETPAGRPPSLTPAEVVFPSEKVTTLTEGWDVVRDAYGMGRLVTTVGRLPANSVAKVQVGSFDLTGLRNPIIRVWARYDLRRNSQSFGLWLKSPEHIERFHYLIRTNEGGNSGQAARFHVPLNQVRGARELSVEFVVETESADRNPGVEIERILIMDDPSLSTVEAPIDDGFDEESIWEVKSGSWEVVPGGGIDGSGALLASSEADGGVEATLELGPSLDLSNVARPTVSFDIDYLEVHPNHTLNIVVECPDFEITYRAIRYQNYNQTTEGFASVSVPIYHFANRSDVRVHLQVQRPQNAQYSFYMDNLRIHDGPTDGTGILQVDASRPYTLYLNGEAIVEGERFRVAESRRITGQAGLNVLAFEMETRATADAAAVVADFGGRDVVRSGTGDWVASDNAPAGWEQPGFFDGDLSISNFENAQAYIGLGAIDGEQDAWAFTGNAWGQRPASYGSQNNFRPSGFERTFFAASFAAGDNGMGSLFSPPFTLEREYLHFLIRGGNFPNEAQGGCTCVRLWGLDEDGERTELLGTWTGLSEGRFSWRRYDVRPIDEDRMVQLEFADERERGWGNLAVDDVYLSNDENHHGTWEKVQTGDAVGQAFNREEWPFIDLSAGARFIRPPSALSMQFRHTFELEDTDEDGILDGQDLCPLDPEPEVLDSNGNGVGDACDPCPDCENIARGARTEASGRHHQTFPASSIVDGDYMEYRDDLGLWLLPSRQTGWVEVDLREDKEVCVFRFKNVSNRGRWDWSTGDWRLAVKRGDELTVVAEGSEPGIPMARWHTVVLEECLVGDSVRFFVDSYNGSGGGLNELEVYGRDVEAP